MQRSTLKVVPMVGRAVKPTRLQLLVTRMFSTSKIWICLISSLCEQMNSPVLYCTSLLYGYMFFLTLWTFSCLIVVVIVSYLMVTYP